MPSTLRELRPSENGFTNSMRRGTDVFYRRLTARKSISFHYSLQWLRTLEGDRTFNRTVFDILQWYSQFSSCPEERVVAIIFGYANGMIDLLSIGINGSSADCLDPPLWVHKRSCEHAEHRALKQLPINSGFYHLICYISLAPCLACAEELFRAGVEAVAYPKEYRDTAGNEFLLNKGRAVYRLRATGMMVPLNPDLLWQPFASCREANCLEVYTSA